MGRTQPAPIDLTEDKKIPAVNTDELLGPDARPRPPGKQRPGKKIKSDTSVSTRGVSLQAIRRYYDKRASSQTRSRRSRVRSGKRKKPTVMRLEEMKFLTISMKDLPEDDAYFIEEQKKAIRAKYNLYQNPGSNPGGSR
ncbi:hypothetical protein Tco_0041438 [Tanacetum coccineum]